MSNRTILLSVAGFAALAASSARAQDATPPPVPTDPEGGDTGQWQTPPTATVEPPAPETAPASEPTPPAWIDTDEERPPSMSARDNERPGRESDAPADTDHARFAGRFGFGLLGVRSVPVGVDPALIADAGVADPTYPLSLRQFSTPTVGVRYWLSREMALEVGIGFNYAKKGLDVDYFKTEDQTGDIVVGWAAAAHAAVPWVLKEFKHYDFLLIPEIDVGLGTATIYGATPQQDQYLNGMMVRIGARAGAEIHCGFIDVPQLAFQATVGAAFTYAAGSGETKFVDNGSDLLTSSTMTAETTLGDSIADMFAANVAAVYYVE